MAGFHWCFFDVKLINLVAEAYDKAILDTQGVTKVETDPSHTAVFWLLASRHSEFWHLARLQIITSKRDSD